MTNSSPTIRDKKKETEGLGWLQGMVKAECLNIKRTQEGGKVRSRSFLSEKREKGRVMGLRSRVKNRYLGERLWETGEEKGEELGLHKRGRMKGFGNRVSPKRYRMRGRRWVVKKPFRAHQPRGK